jgi:hypothetical protein
MPTYLGQLQREAEKSPAPLKSAGSSETAAPKAKRDPASPEKPQP